MNDPTARLIKRTLFAGAAAAAVFGGFAAAPTLLSQQADAREIAISPPRGAPMSFAELVEAVSPAVVSIRVQSRVDQPGGEELPPEMRELFRRFYGQEPPTSREATSLGSGFFIDATGTIVTNHHVVDGATEILVVTSDEKEFKAELVGSDELTDIAVIRLTNPNRRDFSFVRFDTDARLRVGDWVVAVGNPFGLQGTATAGIVSAVGRRNIGGSSFVDFIQTDAPINRGNSGGPTFNLDGRVVGVNSAIFSPTGGNVGIGFAIPAATADNVVRELIQRGRVTRGYLGVTVQQMDEDLARTFGLDEPKGALVAQVSPGGPAATAGLARGDLILGVNGEEVQDSGDLTRKIAGTPVNSRARLEVLRDGQRRTFNVQLTERPTEEQLASATGQSTPDRASGAGEGATRLAELEAGVRPLNAEDRRRLDLGASDTGLVITDLSPDSELASKGVVRGDAILQAANRPIATVADLQAAVRTAKAAERPLQLLVRNREGLSRFLAVPVTNN